MFGEPCDVLVHTAWRRRRPHLHDGTSWKFCWGRSCRKREVVGAPVNAFDDQIAAVIELVDAALGCDSADDSRIPGVTVDHDKVTLLSTQRSLHRPNDVAPLAHRSQGRLNVFVEDPDA